MPILLVHPLLSPSTPWHHGSCEDSRKGHVRSVLRDTQVPSVSKRRGRSGEKHQNVVHFIVHDK